MSGLHSTSGLVSPSPSASESASSGGMEVSGASFPLGQEWVIVSKILKREEREIQ